MTSYFQIWLKMCREFDFIQFIWKLINLKWKQASIVLFNGKFLYTLFCIKLTLCRVATKIASGVKELLHKIKIPQSWKTQDLIHYSYDTLFHIKKNKRFLRFDINTSRYLCKELHTCTRITIFLGNHETCQFGRLVALFSVTFACLIYHIRKTYMQIYVHTYICIAGDKFGAHLVAASKTTFDHRSQEDG